MSSNLRLSHPILSKNFTNFLERMNRKASHCQQKQSGEKTRSIWLSSIKGQCEREREGEISERERGELCECVHERKEKESSDCLCKREKRKGKESLRGREEEREGKKSNYRFTRAKKTKCSVCESRIKIREQIQLPSTLNEFVSCCCCCCCCYVVVVVVIDVISRILLLLLVL